MDIDRYINDSVAYERYAGFLRSDAPYEVYIKHGVEDGECEWEATDLFKSLEDAVHRAYDFENDGFISKVLNKDGDIVYPAFRGEL